MGEALVRVADRVDLQLDAGQPERLPQSREHHDLLGVDVGAGEAQRFGVDLVELPIAALLRALVAEHRAAGPHALRALVGQVVLDRRAHDAGGRLRAQRQRLAVQLVLEGVHLVLDDVGELADAAHEERRRLDDRQRACCGSRIARTRSAPCLRTAPRAAIRPGNTSFMPRTACNAEAMEMVTPGATDSTGTPSASLSENFATFCRVYGRDVEGRAAPRDRDGLGVAKDDVERRRAADGLRRARIADGRQHDGALPSLTSTHDVPRKTSTSGMSPVAAGGCASALPVCWRMPAGVLAASAGAALSTEGGGGGASSVAPGAAGAGATGAGADFRTRTSARARRAGARIRRRLRWSRSPRAPGEWPSARCSACPADPPAARRSCAWSARARGGRATARRSRRAGWRAPRPGRGGRAAHSCA